MRLERLGFFKEVESETLPVAGVNDQIDVELVLKKKYQEVLVGVLGIRPGG